MAPILTTGGGGYPAAGSAFTPASLSGLVAWYSAAAADASVFVNAGSTLATNGQTAQQWNDLSGHNYHLLQATSGARPTYLTNGFPDGGLPGVSFASASSQFMQTAATSVSAMGSGLVGSVFCVGTFPANANSNGRVVSYIGNADSGDTDSANSAAWVMSTGATGQMATYRSGFRAQDNGILMPTLSLRFGNIFDNTNDTNYANNTALAGSASATGLSWTSPGRIKVGGDAAFADAVLCEVVMVNTALTSGERLSLDNYFKTKWGFNVTSQTLNPFDRGYTLAINANRRTFTNSTATAGSARSALTVAASARIYFELRIDAVASHLFAGIANSGADLISTGAGAGGSPTKAGIFRSNDSTFIDVDSANTGGTFATGALVATDVICVAFDSTNGKLWARKNGGAWNSGVGQPDVGSQSGGYALTITPNGPYYVVVGANASGDGGTVRFVTADWGFSPPTGFGELS